MIIKTIRRTIIMSDLLPYKCLCEDLARIGVEPYLSPLSVNLIEPGLKATGRITLFPCNKIMFTVKYYVLLILFYYY